MKKFSLKEEKICNYLVTTEIKKVWKVELNLLEEFIKVCNRNNLNYFITAGSLLGIIRHGGFIPWDDDIDVGMLRKDYDKLIKIANKEFKKPYFLQTPYNDSIYRGHAQLRNSNTSAILPEDIYCNHNQGIFIDIFPYDEYPKKKYQYRIQKFKCNFYKKIMNNYFHKSISMKSKIFYQFSSTMIKIFGLSNIYKHYEKICSKYNEKGSGMVSNLSFKYGRPKYMHKKEYFEDLIPAKFENVDVKIPKEYDKILSKQYGNYHEFKIGTSTHGELYLSAEIPYKEYLKKLRSKDNEKI